MSKPRRRPATGASAATSATRPATKRRSPPRPAPYWQRPGVIVGAALAAAAIIVSGFWLADRPGTSPTMDKASAYVGGDLHTVTVIDGQLFVGGHDGVARSNDGGKHWAQVASLRGADAMGWAQTSQTILVGGHAGLFQSTSRSLSFTKSEGLGPVTDVHAIGAAGDTVYLASPQAGLLVSTDAGASWTSRNASVGQGFMGTILVDPANPNRLVAPDMQNGVVASSDGGQTWKPLGGPVGAMSVTWDPTHTQRLVAMGMRGGALTNDGGRTWAALQTPQGTSAVTFSADGRTLYAATLEGQTALISASSDDGLTWTAS